MLNLGLIPVCCIIIWADAKWLGPTNSLPPQPHFPAQGPHSVFGTSAPPGLNFYPYFRDNEAAWGFLYSPWWQRPGHLPLVGLVPILSPWLVPLEVASTPSLQVFKLIREAM